MSNLDPEILKKAQAWTAAPFDADTQAAVQSLLAEGKPEDITDAFYRDLDFGTGGLRGIMGVGNNRINRYTVGKATQGLANYLKLQLPGKQISVAISCDSRNNSRNFAQVVADVFSANGITVHLFPELRPTPLLSFAVRHLNCDAGVMLTASHNPKEYNGYKAYWNDGGQLVPPHDKGVIAEVNKVAFEAIKFEGIAENIKTIDDSLDAAYVAGIKGLGIRPEAVAAQGNLNIVYSPIHGTGITLVPRSLAAWGFTNVNVVGEQAEPDGNFPTVVYPNPEEEEAMSMGLRHAAATDADLLLATDPDADRVGVGVKNLEGKYILLNGNQIGSLIVNYVLSSKHEKGILPANGFACRTIVTTELFSKIAAAYNVPCGVVLTGFKYIGELMTEKAGKEVFLAGGEESYGFLVGDLVRDKDAVVSCCFIAEMTAYYKAQGKTLYEALLDIYRTYGFYRERLVSLTKKGKTGLEEIVGMMAQLRKAPPTQLGGLAVTRIADYKTRKSYNIDGSEEQPIDLPVSDVLQFTLADGTVISARPSGTEPKIKFYSSTLTAMEANNNDWDAAELGMIAKMDTMIGELSAVAPA
ncbi:MAG: phospho-sugar mutase [Edaphocola sp.]